MEHDDLAELPATPLPKKTPDEQLSVEIKMLDDLIGHYYRRLRSVGNSDIKLGDFLKMIELRRKLNPNDNDQKEFWSMLQKIREQADSEDPDTPRVPITATLSAEPPDSTNPN